MSTPKYVWMIGISVVASIAITFSSMHNLKKSIVKNDIADNIIIVERFKSLTYDAIDVSHSPSSEKGLLIYIDEKSSSSEAYIKQLAGLSYYVAHIEPDALLSKLTAQQACINIADKIKTISQQLQTHYDISNSELPIIVGNNKGAALTYAALAQAEKHSFHAGISINFTPQIATQFPLCIENDFNNQIDSQHANLMVAKNLHSSWYIFQDANLAQDPATNQFINSIGNAKLTTSEKSGADATSQALQVLQWLDSRLPDQTSSNDNDGELPLIEVTAQNPQQSSFVILLTGDGGWAEIDKSLANLLAENGIPTVALDSLSYFWQARTPESTAKAIDDLISLYSEKWQKQQVILIGYSFGADVLPFIANRLSAPNKARITLVALLGMGKTAAFEFKLSSWADADTSTNRLALLPELKHMQWVNSICIYGIADEESACPETTQAGVKVISMDGDHHFDERYDLLTQHILANIKTIPESEASAVK